MKNILQYLLWVIVATLWTTICFIATDFIDNPFEGAEGFSLIVVYICACGIGSFFLLYVIGCNKYISAFFLPIWAILGAIISFYRVGFHVTLTPVLLDVTLHTNIEEALGVVSWSLIIWTILHTCIAIALVLWRWKHIVLPHAWIHSLVGLGIGLSFFLCNDRLQNSLCQRFPYSIPYTTKAYIDMQRSTHQERVTPAYSVLQQPDSLIVVLIIGESVRADHLQINGYKRETNPFLSQQNNIVSFPNIYSEQTHTLACMPYILTRADSINEQYQYTEQSFVTPLRKEGFYTVWLSNQNLGNSFAHFPSECDTAVFANAGKTDYVFTPWMDEELLPIMDSIRDISHPRTLFILHTIGSHWYYNNHVPQEMYYFKPITNNRVITANSMEQIVNSYDNTIRYMDYFVHELITSLENKEAIVFYQSDHGEALGEDGSFLHGHDAKPVHHPACIIWYSDRYAASHPSKIASLIANKDKYYRTEYVFYSILSAAGIRAEGDTQDLDIFQ